MKALILLLTITIMHFQSCTYVVTDKDLLSPQKNNTKSDTLNCENISFITSDSILLNARLVQKKSAIANILILHGNRGNIYILLPGLILLVRYLN